MSAPTVAQCVHCGGLIEPHPERVGHWWHLARADEAGSGAGWNYCGPYDDGERLRLAEPVARGGNVEETAQRADELGSDEVRRAGS